MSTIVFAKRNLYMMKKRRGRPVYLYHIVDTIIDRENGTTVDVKARYKIRKAIFLSSILSRELNIANANRVSPTPTEAVDITSRIIIVDNEDLPTGFQYHTDDYFIIDGDRYNIQRVTELENKVASIFTVRYMEGGQRNEWVEVLVNEISAVTDTLELEVI